MTQPTTDADVLSVDVEIAWSEATNVPDVRDFEDWCRGALAATKARGDAYELALRIVDANESQALNRRYRDRDRPTNVLSFPAGFAEAPPAEPLPLGDIVICGPSVLAEADAAGKAVREHWAHLVVHGVLHLTGYDHENEADALEMEALERQILDSWGIADPYQVTNKA